MISDGTYPQFECSLSNDKHYVQEPIKLNTCVHLACKTCLARYDVIKCITCGTINNKNNENNENNEISDETNISIKTHLDDLLVILEKQTFKSLKQLEAEFETTDEAIDVHIEYVKQEIEIRIESLRIELDNFYDQHLKKLEEIKDIWKNKNSKLAEKNKTKLDAFKDLHIKLQDDIKNKSNKTEEILYEYQKNLQEMNKLINFMKKESSKLTFIASADTINKEIIGKIELFNGLSCITDETIEKSLLNSKFKIFDINVQPDNICVLPNNLLVTVNRDDSNLTVFDSDFNLIKTIHYIGAEKLKNPYGITTDGINRVYISDDERNCIIMTDLEFNQLKCLGKKGKQINEFSAPDCILFHNDNLFVCDCRNKRIVRLTSDLEWIESFKVNHGPWQISAIDNTICVISGTTEQVSFFDATTFKMKQDPLIKFGRLSSFGNLFYLLTDQKNLMVFSNEGLLLRVIDIGSLSQNFTHLWDGCMVFFNGYIVFNCYQSSKLLALEVQF